MMDKPVVWNPYCGHAPAPAELLARWNLDPLLIAGLAAAALLYWHVRVRDRRRDACFASALGLALILFVSPFCALTSALFSARVTHHILLTAFLAPLLVGAIPAGRLRVPLGPWAWTLLGALAFWFWHSPPVYAWALSGNANYWLMQGTLGATAFGFWWHLREAPAPSAVAALLATMVQMGLLGAIITFASRALYAPHLLGPYLWGMSPLQDQQLAGLIMWVPAGGLYLVAALTVAARWLRDAGQAGATA